VGGLLAAAEQKNDLIGVRWDFAKSMALKVQIDRVKPKTKAGTLIFAPAAGYTKDRYRGRRCARLRILIRSPPCIN
jgi:hypothetical protein